MNTKNPVSALRMETGDSYITQVPPIENVTAKNFPWNTIKNISTNVTSAHNIRNQFLFSHCQRDFSSN